MNLPDDVDDIDRASGVVVFALSQLLLVGLGWALRSSDNANVDGFIVAAAAAVAVMAWFGAYTNLRR